MSLPQSPKAAEEHDKFTSCGQAARPHPVTSAKPGTKPDDALNPAFSGAIRVPSPDPSLLSTEDWNIPRVGRSPDGLLGPPGSRRHASRSPAPPRTLKGKVRHFWIANKGLALVLIAQVFGTLMNVTTRILEVEGNNGNGYHPFQILLARMSITVVCSMLYMWRAKTEHFPFGMKEVRLLLVARGLFGFFGVFGMYYSLLYLPLADATVITFLAPSLACWACSYLIDEPFTRIEQIAAYVSLFGVILIARPVSLFSSMKHTGDAVPPVNKGSEIISSISNGTLETTQHSAGAYDNVTPTQRATAVGVALLGVIGTAGAFTSIRWIGKRAHPLLSVNYFASWCVIVSVVMMIALPDVGFLLPASLKDWCYLLFLGICGFVMQFLLAAGLQYEKSSRATNMVYTQMLFALAFDKLVWGTTPGALSIIGSSLILGSAIYVAVHKEADKKDGEHRVRGSSDEERGLMSPDIIGEIEDDNAVIHMRTMRI